jgi:LCP family protein required for cell wall assembly
MRPPSGPTDRRRLFAAGLSAVIPGLGQLANRQTELGRRFLLPTVAALVLVWLVVQLVPLPRLAATFVSPTMLMLLLALNIIVLGWRIASIGQAFFDARFRVRPGRLGAVGLGAILVFVTLPHLVGLQLGLAAQSAFGRIFQSGATLGATFAPGPRLGRERVNILIIGVDTVPGRTATLTDTLMVASLDPVGKTVALLSIPRDLVNTPLGNGNVFGPKLNSLMSYANRNPDEFPGGGKRALQDAVGALLDVRIHYTATMDMLGFVRMVDALGGVDIEVAEGFSDPKYDGFGFGQMGWTVAAGPNHFDGLNALAYVRSRKATGESDFTRQERQQQVLLALRAKLTASGSLVFALPGLLDALGDTVETDFPVDDLPAVAAIFDEIDADAIVRVVIRFPLVGGTTNRYGSVQVPDVPAIQAMARQLFGLPGTRPIPWPTPDPTPQPPIGAPGAPRTGP